MEKPMNISNLIPTSNVVSVGYSVLEQKYIEEISIFQVGSASLTRDNDHENAGLLDRRFGARENEICKVCNQSQTHCVGHFAYIKSSTPYLIPSTSKILLSSILSLFCQSCGCIRNKDLNNLTPERYAELIKKLENHSLSSIKNKLKLTNSKHTCELCGDEIIKFKLLDGKIVQDSRNKSLKKEISHEALFEFASKISTTLTRLLGIKMPLKDLFYYNVVPVPPVNIRPNKTKIPDDLTTSLRAFYLKNLQVKNAIDATEAVDHKAAAQLVLCAYDNSEQYNLKKNKDPVKSLSTSQRGKENRARSNLQARRKDYNCRTVIGPTSRIEYGHLVVPQFFVENSIHNVRVYVYDQNIDILQDMVDNLNPNLISYWNKDTNEKVLIHNNTNKVGNRKKNIVLKYGDHLERKAKDGDVGIFMRQPSLHRENVMTTKLVIDKSTTSLTLRFHPDTVTPFNADFDGDEMNLFTAMDPCALVEQHFLMTFDKNYISSSNSQNNFGSLLSSVIGGYLFTFDKDIPMEVLYHCYANVEHYALKPFPYDKLDAGTLTAFDVLSMFIPNDLSFNRNGVVVVNGIIVESVPWNKKHLGVREPGSIAKIIFDHVNNGNTAMRVSFVFSTIFDMYLIFKGFSISLRDFYLPEEIRAPIEHDKYKMFSKLLDLIHEFEFKITNTIHDDLPNQDLKHVKPPYIHNELLPLNFVNDQTQLESVQETLINIGNMTGLKLFDAIKLNDAQQGRQNKIKVTIDAKSKLSESDIFNMIGAVGQQDIDGKVIQRNLNGRTYPYYPRDNNDPRSFGFVLSSLHEGLRQDEMNNLGSSCKRQNVDVTCKTSETGYRGRQLIKHTEDCIVNNLKMLEDTRVLIQFNFNGIKLDHNKIKYIPFIKPNEITMRIADTVNNRTLDTYINELFNLLKPYMIYPDRRSMFTTIRFSVDAEILINKYPNDDEPVTSIGEHMRLIEWLRLHIFFNVLPYNTISIEYVILTNFHPQFLGKRRRYVPVMFEAIKNAFIFGCNPGFPAGIISAQELQELSTQSSLSSFHGTDTFTVNKSGFNRQKQIVQLNKNAHKKPNKEGFTLTLTCEESKNGKARLGEILNSLRYFVLKYLNPTIKIVKKTYKVFSCYVSIDINTRILYMFGVQIVELTNMIEYWLSVTERINNYLIKINNNKDTNKLEYIIHCNFKSPVVVSMTSFLEEIVVEVSRGKKNILNPNVLHIPNYYNLDGDLVSAYRINLLADSTSVLANFNTEDINIHFSSPWIVFLNHNIISCVQSITEEIADSFEKKEVILVHSNIIGHKMCANVEPVAIDRFELPRASVLKMYAFETGQLVIPKASVFGVTNKVDDNASCIMTGQRIKLGTGLNKLKLDIEMLKCVSGVHEEQSAEDDEALAANKLSAILESEY